MAVDTQHPQYQKMLPIWQKCRDAAEGEDVIHERGTTYLPKLSQEKEQDYQSRKKRAPFFNATWRTISGMKGLIFRKPPVSALPAAIASYAENIDLTGRSLNVFAQSVVEDMLTTGRCGLLVDYPPMPLDDNGDPISVAQAEAMGLRPYVSKYEAASIINWKTARINNVLKTVLVVLEESEDIPGDSEFDHNTRKRYRVLDLFQGAYRQRVIVKTENSEETISETFPRMRGQLMAEIPFIFIGVDDLSPDIDSPPLLDLVNMNLHHYTVGADYEHGCHFSGLPTLFIFGMHPDDENPIYIGGAAANVIPSPEGHAEYAEVVQGFDALRQNLDGKKAEMAILGARMLEAQKASVESGDTQKQRVNGEMSVLAAMANLISFALTKALGIMAQWANAGGEVSYQLNTDFVPEGMTAQELTALVAAWQSGAISSQVLFENLKQGEIIGADTTFEEEQERIRSQGPVVE